MDNRFANMFNLTEDHAIALLKKPLEELKDKSERYVAASHLINFPTERSINALIETIEDTNPDMFHRIARRKAVESLGRLNAKEALPIIQKCLEDEDNYTVENAVWAIGQIGTEDDEVLSAIANLLDRPGQSYRLIIQTLAKFQYQPALETIKPFRDSEDETIASSAITTVARLTQDYSEMNKVVAFLQHTNVNARRLSIQDLIDANYYQAIPALTKAPVSVAFRLRGLRLLAQSAIASGNMTFAEVEPYLDTVIRDRPQDLEMVHEYDQNPAWEFLLRELYQTDFGRCYLGTYTILQEHSTTAPEALIANYHQEGRSDYGAHYHIVKILGWLKYQPGKEVIIEALQNTQPQFQKSRAAAALALGELGAIDTIPLLKEALTTSIFDLKYAALLALEKLGDNTGASLIAEDPDLLLRSKAQSIL
ncbi:PBS lyase HEAT-like repeat protein [Xenococcus sp. PCC 7305]|uniref:HEAT repeat domain-containing protein n=1 Tax=Xenococcus sp. PCC 7305 TaxID=102125 RepID=UPI0002AC7A93|nr:HEAT repeat domain-containing protein [Xenococcus sp. PCC 7305]ELS05273.1 PBS lyase HEAT-like repeat protein [Xenococcus sp. PCC 7305]